MNRRRSRVLGIILAVICVFGILPLVALAEDANSDGYNDHDVARIQVFLDQESAVSGSTNGDILGYDRDDPSTWAGVTWTTDDEKCVETITWNKSNLAGSLDLSGCDWLDSLDLSGCSSLIALNCSQCWIYDITLTGCTALTTLQCDDNAISTLDLSDCTALSTLSCSNNMLTDVKAVISGGTIELNSTGAGYVYLDSVGGVATAGAQSISPAALIDWLEGASVYSTDSELSLTAGENYALTAEFEYIVSFDAMEGSVVEDIAVPGGATISEPDTTCEGYTLIGWYTEDTFENEWVFETDTVTDNMVLYAQWEANDYHITYYANGATSGTAPIEMGIYHVGDTVTAKGNIGSLTKTGSAFTGWNTKADGTGTHYAASASFSMPAQDLPLYAEWEVNYTVTYNRNSGTGTVPTDNTVYHTGDTVTVLMGGLTRTGYTFSGWNTSSYGTGTHYAPESTFTMPSSNVILYAEWKPNYRVTYSGNNGTGTVPTDATVYYSGDTVTVLGNTGGLTKTGCMFNGWNTSSSGSGTHYAPGSTFSMPSSNVTLYAEWKQSYRITYYSNNGTGTVPTDTALYYAGDTVTVLGITGGLAKTGYIFNGWNTSSYGSGTHYAPGSTFAMQAGNVSLYAEWKINYNSHDTGAIQAFLNQNSYVAGKTNAQQLGYTVNNAGTWSGVTWFMSGNEWYAQKIIWNDKALAGSLDLSNFALLSEVGCYSNYLTGLNVSGCAVLKTLDCSDNYIPSLNLSGLSALQYLDCGLNELTSLSVSGLNALIELDCYFNQLGSLDVSGHSALKYLDCSYCSLTSLNLSGCGILTGLYCDNNSLTSITHTSTLKYFDCRKNPMTSVNVYLQGSSQPVQVLHNASGPGYVGLYFYYGNLPIAYATPITPATFSKWTLPDRSTSATAELSLKTGGAYTATFVYNQGAYLSNVGLNAGALSRAFSRTVYSYKVNLGENEGSVTITPERLFQGLGMTINGQALSSYTVNVANGKTATVKVKVTYGKENHTYTFTVTRAKSGNNNLASLSATAGSFDRAFDPNVTNYTLTLDENTKSTKILGAVAAPGFAKASPASTNVTLNNGQTKVVKITVKAQSGAKKTYVITVTRAAATNAGLKSLKTGKFPLSPAFSAGVTNYTVALPAATGSVTISASAAGYKAVVYIDGKKKTSLKVNVASGGSVTVHIVVVAQAGNTMDYYVTITRP